ncbi:hypothetical protein [Nonomuraea sp. NPDC049625]|uniref:hypothetical protein n=1 Tax=Nonomuraea sp. NPDC049625 TaxID=3155775 RepID=UPI00342F98C1
MLNFRRAISTTGRGCRYTKSFDPDVLVHHGGRLDRVSWMLVTRAVQPGIAWHDGTMEPGSVKVKALLHAIWRLSRHRQVEQRELIHRGLAGWTVGREPAGHLMYGGVVVVPQ